MLLRQSQLEFVPWNLCAVYNRILKIRFQRILLCRGWLRIPAAASKGERARSNRDWSRYQKSVNNCNLLLILPYLLLWGTTTVTMKIWLINQKCHGNKLQILILSKWEIHFIKPPQTGVGYWDILSTLATILVNLFFQFINWFWTFIPIWVVQKYLTLVETITFGRDIGHQSWNPAF